MRRCITLSAAMATVLLVAAAAMANGSPNAQVRAALDRTLPGVNFISVSVKDAIDFLRDVSAANIHVNWKALEAAGVTPDTTINLRLRQVSLRKVLTLILREASGTSALAFYTESGVIEVTTREQADSIMYVIVYPVHDLLVEVPELVNVPESGGLWGTDSSRGSDRNYGDSRMTGDSRTNGRTNNPATSATSSIFGPLFNPASTTPGKTEKKTKSDELMELIQQTISPAMWMPNGQASIKFYNGCLVVNAPRSVHEQLGGPID